MQVYKRAAFDSFKHHNLNRDSEASEIKRILFGVRAMGWGANDYLFAALFGLSVVSGVVCGWQLLKVKPQPEKVSLLTRFLTAIVLSILIALATLLSTSPFQIGHSLGIGLLSSVVGSSLAFWLGVIGARFWLGYLGTLLPFLIPLTFHSDNPFPSLFGIMIGTVLVWFCIGNVWSSHCLTIVSLVAAIGLARFHEPPTGIGKQLWQALPLSLTIAGWFGVGGLWAWQRYWQGNVSRLTSAFVPSVLLLLGAAFMGYWGNDWRFLTMVLLACFTAAIAQEIYQTQLRDLTVLLWVGLLVISFAVIPTTDGLRLLGGYGAALASVALAWLAVGQNDERTILIQGANFLTTFALFRFFAEVYPLRTPRADLYTHYTFVGFLLGATIPVMLMRWMEQKRHFVRDLEVGFWSAVVPVILGAVWGVKAVAGYLAGGIASVLLVPPFNSPTLFAGFATALPLTALVEPASDLPRKIRIWILVGAAIAFAITLLVDTFVERLGTRKR